MPNICTTNFIIEGDKEKVMDIFNVINKAYCESRMKLSDFGKELNLPEVHYNGICVDICMDGDILKIQVESYWKPPYSFMDVFRNEFNDLNLWYFAEELCWGGCEVFETNDRNGKFFDTERIYVAYSSPYGEENVFYCDTWDDVHEFLVDFGVDVRCMDDVKRVDDEWRNEDCVAYLRVYECKVAD